MSIFPTTDEVPFTPRCLWRGGEIVPWHEANVHVSSIGHASVSSVFEGIKAYWNREREELFVFRLEEHIERFMESIRLVRLGCEYSQEQIVDAILELLRANDTRADVYIRPWIYATGRVREMMLLADHPTELVIDTWWFHSRMLEERGCRALVSSWSRIDGASMPPRIKAFSNYHNGRLGIMEARERGAEWPIFLNRESKVTEGPASCIAMVRRGELVTPPLGSGILDSITRRTLLSLVPDATSLRVVERDIDRTELYLAEELFFLGTGWEILPILEVDGYRIGDGAMGPQTRLIDRAYHDAVRGLTARYSQWRTGVWGAPVSSAAVASVWSPKGR
jgi:branched-chain amino acid aminotransferase